MVSARSTASRATCDAEATCCEISATLAVICSMAAATEADSAMPSRPSERWHMACPRMAVRCFRHRRGRLPHPLGRGRERGHHAQDGDAEILRVAVHRGLSSPVGRLRLLRRMDVDQRATGASRDAVCVLDNTCRWRGTSDRSRASSAGGSWCRIGHRFAVPRRKREIPPHRRDGGDPTRTARHSGIRFVGETAEPAEFGRPRPARPG